MADQMTNEVIDQETAEAQMVEVVQPAIEKLIYVIRDKQVMIDSDLAMLYHVETKRLNEAVKRNIARFPEEFRFQLTEKETESLRSQIATSMKSNGDNEKKGGRRYTLQTKIRTNSQDFPFKTSTGMLFFQFYNIPYLNIHNSLASKHFP